MLVTCKSSEPVLDTVRVRFCDCDTIALPNVSEVATEIAGWMPVPESETTVGVPGALCVIEREAERAPVADGENVSVMS